MKMKHVLLAMLLVAFSAICHAHDDENFVASDLFASLKEEEKAALLMVHFGTTHDDTRALTIDAVNQKAKEAFKGVEFREAWTSRIVMRRLKARGVQKQNPIEALEQLKADGYTHILVQSTNIIEGAEMESLRKDIASMQKHFKEIRVGNPLLYSPEDYETVIASISGNNHKEMATLLVGHGTYTPATAQYAMLDYMLKEKGFGNFFVGTIEGYPTFDTAEAQIKTQKYKKILLMPFMFVAGDHAKNDIAGEWKEALEKKGYQVDVHMEGLGQNPGVQQLFIDHLRFISTHKAIDITAKKRAYAVAKD